MKGAALALLLSAPAAAGVDRAGFDAVIAAVDAVYATEAAARGERLVFKPHWETPIVDAISQRAGPKRLITIFGGLARHPAMTSDGFAAALCHEIGHHFGGEPRVSRPSMSWGSTEGQADYFAGGACLRRVLPLLPESASPVPDGVREACAVSGAPLCARVAAAGLSFIRVFAEFQREEEPRFDSPDAYRAWTTLEDYPSAQCRLDTFFEASLCPRADGACVRAEGYARGVRPACWYKPPVPTPEPGRFVRLR